MMDAIPREGSPPSVQRRSDRGGRVLEGKHREKPLSTPGLVSGRQAAKQGQVKGQWYTFICHEDKLLPCSAKKLLQWRGYFWWGLVDAMTRGSALLALPSSAADSDSARERVCFLIAPATFNVANTGSTLATAEIHTPHIGCMHIHTCSHLVSYAHVHIKSQMHMFTSSLIRTLEAMKYSKR